MTTTRTYNPLSTKLLSLSSYVEPYEHDSDIKKHLLKNTKNKYEGKKSNNEGIIVKILEFGDDTKLQISNLESTGCSEGIFQVKCLTCLISPKNIIACKILEVSNVYHVGEAIGGKIVIFISFPENKQSFFSKITKNSIVIVKTNNTVINNNVIIVYSSFEDFANEEEIKNYYINEHLSSSQDNFEPINNIKDNEKNIKDKRMSKTIK